LKQNLLTDKNHDSSLIANKFGKDCEKNLLEGFSMLWDAMV